MKTKSDRYNYSLMISAFATAIATGILPILLNEIIDTFNIAGTKEGLMSSMVSFGSLISLCIIIFLQKKFSKAYLIIFFGFLTVTTMILQGLAGTYIIFSMLCFIMGFGNGGVDTCQSSLLADLNPECTSKYMGMLHGIFGIASILSPIIIRNILEVFSWRKVYFICAIVCLLCIFQFAISTYNNKERISSLKINRSTENGRIPSYFKNKYNIVLLMFIFCGAAAQSGVIIWVIRYVTIHLGQKEIATACLSVYWITSTISRFVSPRLPFKSYQIISIGALISCIAWTASVALNSSLIICAACAVVGLTSGSCIPMCLSDGAVFNRNNTGFSTSTLMIFKTVGQMLSPILIAFVMSVINIRAGMFVTSVLFLMDALLGIFLKKYYEKLPLLAI
jgi:predicted MFS family arabinose efflux permease